MHPPYREDISPQTCLTALLLLSLLSAVLITVFFAPGDILSSEPMYTDDYSMHYAQCISTKRFFLTEGKCWGYDPYFLAGFPRGVLVNADNKAWELYYFLLSPLLGSGFAFKSYVLLFLLLYPLCIHAAARNFSLSRAEALLSAFLGILFLHLSLCIDLIKWGMVSYVIMCFYSLYVASLFYRLLAEFTWKRYAAVMVCGTVLLMMHILAPLHIFIVLVILYIVFFRNLSTTRHAAVLLLPVMILAFNSYWLIPIAQMLHYKTDRPENYAWTLQIRSIFEPFIVYVKQCRSIPSNAPTLNNTFFEACLLLFGLKGLFHLFDKGHKKTVYSLAGGFVFVFFLTYYGSHFDGLAQFQPQRFAIPLNLFLLIPAAAGLAPSVRRLFLHKTAGSLIFIFTLLFVVLYKPVLRPFGIYYKHKTHRLSCTFPVELHRLLDAVKKHTSREGRILIEDSESGGGKPEEYYGGHYPALFPEHVKREYLAGPRPMYPIKHSYASFASGVLFEKNITDYSLDTLKKMFDIYNVKWIVCWKRESIDFFNRFPDYIRNVCVIDKFTLFEVFRTPSYFLQGGGVVVAGYNYINVESATAEDAEIVLSYHWHDTLRVEPAGTLKRVMIGDDPIGFIGITDPPAAFRIRNLY